MRSDETRRRHPLRRLVLVFGLAFLAIGALATYRMVSASRDLHEVRDLVNTAGVAVEEGRLGDARQQLEQAEQLILKVNGTLYAKPELGIITVIPGVSANLNELREAVGIGAELIVGGRRLLEAATPLEGPDGRLEVPLAEGAIPVDAVEEAATRAQDLLGALPTSTELESRRFILGPIRSLRDELAEEADHRRAQLRDLSRGLEIIADMSGADGDRRYLIAVANTAEMRGSGGMMLNYGVLEGSRGDFELTEFGRVGELPLATALPAGKVTLPDDVADRWEGSAISQDWRSASLPADFTIVGPHLASMYEFKTGQSVNGVIQVDPTGLAAILEGIGPIRVPEVGEVNADNVEALTLNEAYFRFPGIDERSDVLGDIAEATFRKLVDGEYDSLRPLGRALLRSVTQRHIVVYNDNPNAQRSVAYFGADGTLPPVASDNLHLTVQNTSGNKLDYYLDTTLKITGTRDEAGVGRLTATITLTNTAPKGTTDPRYVFGPFDEEQVAGRYRGIVTLYLPASTSLGKVSGDPTASEPSTGTEGGRQYVSYRVAVDAGETQTATLELVLPPRPAGPFNLMIVPSPRIRPTALEVDLTVDGEPVRGKGPLEIPLLLTAAPSDD